MKILSITSVLPIPSIFEDNNVTLKFFSHLCEMYPDTIVEHVYPAVCAPRLVELFSSKWALFNKICRKRSFDSEGMHVRICPYYAVNRFAWTKALTSHSLVWFNKQFEKEMNMDDFDVIHAQKIFPAGVLACYLAKKYKKPLVFSVRRELEFWNHWYSRYRARKILQQADSIASINYNMYELLVRDGFDSQFIPHGLDGFFFNTYDRETPANPVRVLSLCRLLKNKYLDQVLRALKSLQEKGVVFVYTIAGAGDEEAHLRSLVNELGLSAAVEFVGRVEYKEVPQVMKNHDIFVMPSSPEVMGRVYFEAMSQGLPIICAKGSGIDGFFENWISGISVNHQSVSDIENALEQLLVNKGLRKKIGQSGKHLVSKFGWDYIAKTYRSIYDKLCGF